MRHDTYLTTLELASPKFEFSAGHFTIFSATEREPLHGHNYNLQATIIAAVQADGITFDYRAYKQIILKLCRQLNSHFLLPAFSPHLRLEEAGDYYHLQFDQEMIPFLKKDVVILPIRNTTLEEMAKWFVEELIQDKAQLAAFYIHSITIKLLNGTGQAAFHTWSQHK